MAGYNVLVGGGMGMTPRLEKTFPALAQRMASIRPEQAARRGAGDPLGLPRLRQPLRPPAGAIEVPAGRLGTGEVQGPGRGPAWDMPWTRRDADDVWDIDDHVGWHEQGDGRWFYGLHVAGGRIADCGEMRLKSALREICRKHQPPIGLTPGQGILFCDVPLENRAGIEDLLRRHGVKLDDELSNVRRWARACVALPTCSRAVTESERALPGVLDQLEVDLADLGLAGERLTRPHDRLRQRLFASVQRRRWAGRPGRGPLRHLPRRPPLGHRLGFLYQEGVPLERIVPTLVPLLTWFQQHRRETRVSAISAIASAAMRWPLAASTASDISSLANIHAPIHAHRLRRWELERETTSPPAQFPPGATGGRGINTVQVRGTAAATSAPWPRAKSPPCSRA